MNEGNPIALPPAPPAGFLTAPGRSFFRDRAGAVAALLCLALLGVLMGLVAHRLFTGITKTGMTGVDPFQYWSVTYGLLHGHYDFDTHRLAFYVLNALALELLGSNDYAIRAFVGGFAVLNIVLVYLLAYRLAANSVIALAAAALYAFNPIVLRYAALEMPHVAGATFVLLGALLALRAADQSSDWRARGVASFVLGMSLAAAAMTHEDLIFVGVGYFIVVALPLARVTSRPHAALNAGLFVLGAAAAGGCLMIAFGLTPWKLVHDLVQQRGEYATDADVRTGGEFFATVPVRILRNFTVDTVGSVATALAALVAAVAPIGLAVRRDHRLKMLMTLELPLVVYLTGFLAVSPIFLGNYQRMFVPLIGPMLVLAICGVFLLVRPPLRWATAAAIVAWTAYIVVDQRPWSLVPPVVSAYRQLYDALKDRVTSQRKLLLPACFAIDFPYVGIGSDVYLGGNVVPIYLLQHFVGLDALIAANRVGYVFVPDAPRRGMWPRERVEQLFRETYGVAMDRTMLEALPRLSQDLWRGDTRVEWTGTACHYEAQVLRRLLDERGSRVVLTVHDLGDVYELTQ